MNERILNLLEELIIETSAMDMAIAAGANYYDQKYKDEPTLQNKFKKFRFNKLAGNHYKLRTDREYNELKNKLEGQKQLEHTVKHGSSQKAQKEHDNAELNQGLRKNLEKAYQKS